MLLLLGFIHLDMTVAFVYDEARKSYKVIVDTL